MVHDAVSGTRPSVHADEERGIAAGLEELRVLRPLVLDDELAVGIEVLGHEGVERPPLPRAMAVHDDDLGRAERPWRRERQR